MTASQHTQTGPADSDDHGDDVEDEITADPLTTSDGCSPRESAHPCEIWQLENEVKSDSGPRSSVQRHSPKDQRRRDSFVSTCRPCSKARIPPVSLLLELDVAPLFVWYKSLHASNILYTGLCGGWQST